MKTENILDFLTELRQNNNREWFQENKPFYQEVREIYEELIDSLIPELKKMDASILSPTAKNCMFRIYKDARFSKGEEPFKPNFGAFISGNGRKSETAGYYVHIEPGNSFIGGGIYRPQPKVLKSIRNEIFYNATAFKEILNAAEFKSYFPEIYGAKLKTAPRGFPKDFEDVALLRHKNFAVIHKVEDTFFAKENLEEEILAIFRVQQKYNAFLNAAL